MTIKIYVPIDSTAQSLGANEIAIAIESEAQKRKLEIELIRNGSRGLFWLEPLVEVVHKGNRIAYGPIIEEDVKSLFDSKFYEGGQHDKYLGKTDEIAWLKNQERLTFARVGITDPLSLKDYLDHEGFVGLKKAVNFEPQKIVDEVKDSGLRGRGGAAFPTGIKWQTVLDTQSSQKYSVCNADEGDSGSDRRTPLLLSGRCHKLRRCSGSYICHRW